MYYTCSNLCRFTCKKVGTKTLKSELYQQQTEVGFITDFDPDYDANMKIRLVWNETVSAGIFPTCVQVVS